jgi:hypothetical protein
MFGFTVSALPRSEDLVFSNDFKALEYGFMHKVLECALFVLSSNTNSVGHDGYMIDLNRYLIYMLDRLCLILD